MRYASSTGYADMRTLWAQLGWRLRRMGTSPMPLERSHANQSWLAFSGYRVSVRPVRISFILSYPPLLLLFLFFSRLSRLELVMATLADLPNELLHRIIGYAHVISAIRQSTLCTLALVSGQFRDLANDAGRRALDHRRPPPSTAATRDPNRGLRDWLVFLRTNLVCRGCGDASNRHSLYYPSACCESCEEEGVETLVCVRSSLLSCRPANMVH